MLGKRVRCFFFSKYWWYIRRMWRNFSYYCESSWQNFKIWQIDKNLMLFCETWCWSNFHIMHEQLISRFDHFKASYILMIIILNFIFKASQFWPRGWVNSRRPLKNVRWSLHILEMRFSISKFEPRHSKCTV